MVIFHPQYLFNFEIKDGNNAEYLRKRIDKVAESLNINISDMKESELVLAKGAYAEDISGTRREILIYSRNTETQSLATSIHELAHAKLHNINEEGSKFSPDTKEFQVELTSYIVCKHFRTNTSEKLFLILQVGRKLKKKAKLLKRYIITVKEFIDIMDQVVGQEKNLHRLTSRERHQIFESQKRMSIQR